MYDKYDNQIYDDFLTQIFNKYDDQYLSKMVWFWFMINRFGLVLNFS